MTGPNRSADFRRSPACRRNRPTRITSVIGTTRNWAPGRSTVRPFNRAQDRDRRRQGAVGKEKRRAEHAEHAQHRPAPGHAAGQDQRRQREHATLAAVVRVQDHGAVLDADDDDQRPDDQRQDAEHVGRLGHLRRDRERGAKGIQRTGADVADRRRQGTARAAAEFCVMSRRGGRVPATRSGGIIWPALRNYRALSRSEGAASSVTQPADPPWRRR